jgi:hypothetical protein
MKLPNFFIVGAMKAGTTSLASWLGQHPQVFMHPVKEPNFFAFEGGVPPVSGPGVERLKFIPDLETYARGFDAARPGQAMGEASTVYLYSAVAPERIHSRVPHARLIAVLRHPVDRAYSNFIHNLRHGFETLPDFAQAVDAEPDRIRKGWDPIWHYMNRGFYHAQLSRFDRWFPRDRIRVFLFEDLCRDPGIMMREVFGFLGIDDRFTPDVSRAENVGALPRSGWSHRTWIRTLPIRRRIRDLLPTGVRAFGSRSLAPIFFRRPDPLGQDLRRRLILAFREDIGRLEDRIERDLSEWLEE